MLEASATVLYIRIDSEFQFSFETKDVCFFNSYLVILEWKHLSRVDKLTISLIILNAFLTQRINAYRDICFAVQDYSAAIENMLLTIVEL